MPDLEPPPQPLAQRAARGGLWVMASSYWVIGLGFVANILLTRLLNPEVFGAFSLAMFFAQLLRLQPKLGLGYAYSQNQQSDTATLTTYVMTDSLAVFTGGVLGAVAVPILIQLGYPEQVAWISLILSLSLMAEGLAGIGSILMDKELLFEKTSLVQAVAFPISYLPAFWLALHQGGIWSLVAQNLIYTLFSLLGIAFFVRPRLPQPLTWRQAFRPELARRFLRFGLTVGLSQMAGILLTQLDNFMIGSFVGLVALGLYDRAYRIAEWPNKLLASLTSRTVFFVYARLQDDRLQLEKALSMILWLIIHLALPLALAIFVAAPDLLTLLYGPEWVASALFLRILVIYSIVRPLWENAGALFIAIGKPRSATLFAVVPALVLMGSGIPLTLTWGAIGTCAAVGLAFGVGLVLIYGQLRQLITLRLEKVLGLPLLVSLITLAGYWGLLRFTALATLPLLPRTLLEGSYAITAFLGLTFLIQPATTIQRLQTLWRLVRKTPDLQVDTL